MNKRYQVWAGEGDVLHRELSTNSMIMARVVISSLNKRGYNTLLKMRMETGEYMRVNPWDSSLPA